MLLEPPHERQKTIEATIQPRVVDFVFRDVQQIVQWGVPMLLNGRFHCRDCIAG
jgi:hypothetical protein